MKRLLIGILFTLFSTLTLAFDKTKPVTVIIPYAPGGGVDLTFKHFQRYMLQTENVALIPMYKPGADGIIGGVEVAKAKKDGHVILLGTIASMAATKMRHPDQDFWIITSIKESVMSWFASNNAPFNTLDEFVDALKRGEKFSMGYGAPGHKVNIDQLVEITKSPQPLMVPYKGSAPLINDMMGGFVNAAIAPYNLVKTHISGGKLKLIALEGDIIKKFPKWEQIDGFCAVLPGQPDPDALQFWTTVLKNYMSDPSVLKDFAADDMHAVKFGNEHAMFLLEGSIRRLKKSGY